MNLWIIECGLIRGDGTKADAATRAKIEAASESLRQRREGVWEWIDEEELLDPSATETNLD